MQDNETIMCGFYCIPFIDALDAIYAFIPLCVYINILKINMEEEASLEFRLK